MQKYLRSLLLCCLVAASANFSYGQLVKKVAFANRTTADIKIDGVLDEAAWEGISVAKDFNQLEPEFDGPVTQKTEVKILYDDDGIYIGAMMYDTEPEKILTQLSRRDDRENVDWFGVTLDTYRDGRNAFAFIITAAGVQTDIRISNSDDDDVSWDAVWDSNVKITDEGWIAELYIPYFSLRFPDQEIQAWNVQFAREIRRRREQLYWNRIDPTINGFVNHCGNLDGITNIESPVRLSVNPFVVGYVNNFQNKTADVNISEFTYGAGMDLKYGINDAFTLDMTLIPDFGQAQSDNLVLNLSPFEVFFEEQRQFFKEGTELFGKGNLFYSRRVGGRPINYFRAYDEVGASEVLESNPSVSKLYNATKVSGRNSNGTGIGIFNAIAGEEFATIRNTITDEVRQVKTNPLTNYNVFVVDQNLPNNGSVSLVNTNVLRFGDDYDANTTGAFFNLNNKSQKYGVEGRMVFSQKYFQGSSNDIGHSYAIAGGKVGGNFQAVAYYVEESDNYDINDLGFLFAPNERGMGIDLSYTDFDPKWEGVTRWEIGVEPDYSRLYKPNVFADFGINWNTFVLFDSRNAFGFSGRIEPIETFDYFEPRLRDFSRAYRFPKNWNVGGFFSSDYRKVFAFDIRLRYRKFDDFERDYTQVFFAPRVRVSDKFSFILGTEYQALGNDEGFINKRDVPTSLYSFADEDILFGRRDRRIIENSLTAQYIFNHLMSVNIVMRHYWDNVKYNDFGLLQEDGHLQYLDFNGLGENGRPIYDRNINFFAVDLNYIWRFAPGSDLIFNFKNNTSSSLVGLNEGYLTNLVDLFEEDQFNSVSVRLIYFLDYNSMVRRKK